MTNLKKLLMFAATGLLAPLSMEAAHAEIGAPVTKMVVPSPTNDTAPINNGRLRRTDEEQAGFEMPSVGFFDGNKEGLYFGMSTELPALTTGGPVRPATHRMQLAVIPFSLTQGATGGVEITPDLTKSRFVTNNIGNEYRNANAPCAFPILGGKYVAVKYNYQDNNSGDTKAYVMAFDKTGATVLNQTLLFAKNNDDAYMQQDGSCGEAVSISPTKDRFIAYGGANGNGRDDGWAIGGEFEETTPGTVTFRRTFDLSLCPREERSRGACTVAASDPNTAICTWTEGNSQPQRDGTWMAAVNIGEGENGENVQSRLLWKKQIDGRTTEDGITTYSMRAMHERIQAVNPTTGKLENTNRIIFRAGDLRGNNNNNGKGGTYYRSKMAVIEATAAGMTYITPLTDTAFSALSGIDGTHLGMTFGIFGTTTASAPGVVFLSGSHTGGGASAKARFVTWDAATGAFADAGTAALAPHDRHLYPNYLGNNPGNQGRNHSWMRTIVNPFVGQNGNTDAYLLVAATSGKSVEDMMYPERKLSAFLTIVPTAQTPKTGTGGTGSGSGSDNPDVPGGGGEEGGDDGSGTALGGCSTTGNSTGGFLTFLLVGLAALIRRRR
ncbi:MAG: MYXO-CTERM sorting domain-containing protein [Kofleriaceae bacterium]|nr:MYXO-CTERM sorting domain-containing protein [Kofleriaceae bacterium]